MRKRLYTLAVIILAVAGLDQLTKAIAVSQVPPGGVSLIPGFLDFILVYNTGAAFSMFAGQDWSRWLLSVMTLVALFVVLWLVKGPLGSYRGALLSLGLVAGGAVGNLIDRLRMGKVTDFIDLHYYHYYHWPAFNLADIAITAGGLWLALYFIRGKV